MEILTLVFLLWAWDGGLWEKVDPEPEPLVEQVIEVPESAVDVTQVTQTAAVMTAIAESLMGTSSATSTTDAEIEAQIIEELENMDVTTTTTSTTTSSGTSTSTSTSTGT